MSKFTQQQKRVLAKLLATENITVEHRNVQTAMFDVHNRLLILPTWDNMSESVYDMLVGHEVGHALFTPSDLDALERDINSIDADHPGRVKTLLNIVEDARIEKKMKRKFPGLRRDFHHGYKDFLDQGLFGEIDDGSRMAFIDKVNVYFKAGSLAPNYNFSDYEKSIIDKIEKVETFKGVTDIVREMYDYVGGNVPEFDEMEIDYTKSNQQGGPNGWETDTKEANSGPGENSTDGEQSDSSDQSGTGSDGERLGDDAGGNTQSKKGTESDGDLEERSQSGNEKAGGRGHQHSHRINQFESNTQQAMDDYIKSSYNPTMNPDLTINVPKLDSSRYIEDYPRVLKGLEEHFTDHIFDNKWFVRELLDQDCDKESFQVRLKQGYLEWKRSIGTSVNYMAKEFEMRKSADQHARASVNKTGTLNTNRIHQYRYNEDIFRRITILPDGKDHAMIMLVDWSGSMDNSITNTILQTMTLVLFCRKVNIPFEVYCFSDVPKAYRDVINPIKDSEYSNKDLYIDYFVLRNMFSSRMNNTDLEKSLCYFFAIAQGYNYSTRMFSDLNFPYATTRNLIPAGWDLGGTPLNDSLIALRDFVERYRKENKSTIINLILLTDGDSATSAYMIDKDSDQLAGMLYDEPQYVDPYNDSSDVKDDLVSRLNTGARVETFSHNQNNIRLKDPYTNDAEYVAPASQRTGTYVTSWYKNQNHNLTNTLIRSISYMPRVNVIGFFIVDNKYSAKNAIGTHIVNKDINVNYGYIDFKPYLKDFRKDKYLVNEDHDGYDVFFLLSGGKDLEIETDGLSDDLVGESKRKLTTAFKKHSKAKLQSKVFLTKFVERISQENF